MRIIKVSTGVVIMLLALAMTIVWYIAAHLVLFVLFMGAWLVTRHRHRVIEDDNVIPISASLDPKRRGSASSHLKTVPHYEHQNQSNSYPLFTKEDESL